MVRKYKLKLKSKQGGSRERARSVPPKISKKYLPEQEESNTSSTSEASGTATPGHSCNYQANTQEVTLRDVERPPRVYEDEKGTYIMDGEKKKRICFTSGAHNHQANKQTVNLVLSGLTTQAKRKPRKPRAPKLKPDEEQKKEEDKTEEEKKAEGQSTAYREPGLNGPRPDPSPKDQAEDPRYKLGAFTKLLLQSTKQKRSDAKKLLGLVGKLPNEQVKTLLNTIQGRNPLLPGVALPSWVDFALGDRLGKVQKIIPNDPYKIMAAIDIADDPEQKQNNTMPVETREVNIVKQPDADAIKKQREADAEAKRKEAENIERELKEEKDLQAQEIDTDAAKPYAPFKVIPLEQADPALYRFMRGEPATVEVLPDDDEQKAKPPAAQPAQSEQLRQAADVAMDLPDLDEQKPLIKPPRSRMPELTEDDENIVPEVTEEEEKQQAIIERKLINRMVQALATPNPAYDSLSGYDRTLNDVSYTILRQTLRGENATVKQNLFKAANIPIPESYTYMRTLTENLPPKFVAAFYNAITANPIENFAGKNGPRSRNRKIMEDMIVELKPQKDGRGNRKPSIMVGLYDTQIDDMMRGYPEYVGCISRDEIDKLNLPEKIGEPGHGRFGFVYNTVPSNKPTVYDGHWRAIYIDLDNDKEIDHYDSYGDPAEPDIQAQIKRLLDQFNLPYYLKWKDNRVVDQRANSNNCGYFATSFLMDRFAGKPFKDASGYSNIQAGERKARGLNKKFKYLT